jgi:hypothetical protein
VPPFSLAAEASGFNPASLSSAITPMEKHEITIAAAIKTESFFIE